MKVFMIGDMTAVAVLYALFEFRVTPGHGI